MSDKSNWILSLTRIGVTVVSGGALSSSIQLLSELKAGLDSNNIANRIKKLEDPIANIHPDVLDVSNVLYIAMCGQDSNTIKMNNQTFEKYRRSLSMLEAEKLILHHNSPELTYPVAIEVSDPYYLIYSAAINGKSEQLNLIAELMEKAKRGTWLYGDEIVNRIGCPAFLLDAFFSLWQSKGLGLKSNIQGESRFLPQA